MLRVRVRVRIRVSVVSKVIRVSKVNGVKVRFSVRVATAVVNDCYCKIKHLPQT